MNYVNENTGTLRNWVRVTYLCNNNCIFCLDRHSHDGSCVPDNEIKTRFLEGIKKGSSHLIISGGEATIHPKFIELIRFGKKIGYHAIQTITNGRLFSYQAFLTQCIEAGLSEITFSLHGHNPALHDYLTGVPGSFKQALQGLDNVLKDNRVIVNIDICINRQNIPFLPEILAFFHNRGVNEFDLLFPVPFGSAWQGHNRAKIFYPIQDYCQPINAAINLAKENHFQIWFNRFPPPYLEGNEDLIQSPLKLRDEVRGRFEELNFWLQRGITISCCQEERCEHCYIQNFCQYLKTIRSQYLNQEIDGIKIDLRQSEQNGMDLNQYQYKYLWLKAKNLQQLTDIIVGFDLTDSNSKLIFQLDDYTGFCQLLHHFPIDIARLERVYLSKKSDIETLLSKNNDIELLLSKNPNFRLYIFLSQATADFFQKGPGSEQLPLVRNGSGQKQLPLVLVKRNSLDTQGYNCFDLNQFFQNHSFSSLATENIPPCIGGKIPHKRLNILDSSILAGKSNDLSEKEKSAVTETSNDQNKKPITVGDPAFLKGMRKFGSKYSPEMLSKNRFAPLDLFALTEQYIGEHYYSKSIRCQTCSYNNQCEGMHISYISKMGYKVLQPEPRNSSTDDKRPSERLENLDLAEFEQDR